MSAAVIPSVSLKCSLRPSLIPSVSIMKRRRNQRQNVSPPSPPAGQKDKKKSTWFRKKKTPTCPKRPAPSSADANGARKRHKGMRNLGNTCYLNSAIQMLMGLGDFEGELKKAKEDADSLGDKIAGDEKTEYPLRDALVEIFQRLREPLPANSTFDPVNPTQLKDVVDELTPQFKGFRQQDAHEFLSTLLDLLHDETRTPCDKNDAGENDSDETQEEEARSIQRAPSTEDMDIDSNADTQLSGKKQRKEVSAPAAKLMGGQAPGAAHNLPPSLRRSESTGSERDMESSSDDHVKESTNTPVVPLASVSPASVEEDISSTTTSSSPTSACASPVDAYFTTKVRISLTCNSCKIVRTKEEEYRYISIEVNEDKKKADAASLTEGLKQFFSPEKREAKCEKCSCPTATQTMEITRLPRALILHFKRFLVDVSPDYSKITYRKNHSPVKFGETMALTPEGDNSFLAEYLAEDVIIPSVRDEEQACEGTPVDETEEERGDDDVEMSLDPQDDDSSSSTASEADSSSESPTYCYRLRSVVNHSGASSNHGHYTADSLRTCIPPSGENCDDNEVETKEGEWVRFNDTRVSCITPKDAMGINSQRTAYMVVYELGWHI